MSKQKKSFTLYRNFTLENRPEQALIRNRGRRFEIAHFARWPARWATPCRKQPTCWFCALFRKTRPVQFQLARPLVEKRQK